MDEIRELDDQLDALVRRREALEQDREMLAAAQVAHAAEADALATMAAVHAERGSALERSKAELDEEDGSIAFDSRQLQGALRELRADRRNQRAREDDELTSLESELGNLVGTPPSPPKKRATRRKK